jgi:hypothetical protein
VTGGTPTLNCPLKSFVSTSLSFFNSKSNLMTMHVQLGLRQLP